jgi:hypothetical protein
VLATGTTIGIRYTVRELWGFPPIHEHDLESCRSYRRKFQRGELRMTAPFSPRRKSQGTANPQVGFGSARACLTNRGRRGRFRREPTATRCSRSPGCAHTHRLSEASAIRARSVPAQYGISGLELRQRSPLAYQATKMVPLLSVDPRKADSRSDLSASQHYVPPPAGGASTRGNNPG